MATKTVQYATRESILGFADRETKDIPVPEWGGMVVRIRGLTASERDKLEEPLVMAVAQEKSVGYANFRAQVVALGCINEDGSPMFTLKDAAALGDKSAAAITRIADAITALSKITPEDAEALGKGIAATNGSGSGSS